MLTGTLLIGQANELEALHEAALGKWVRLTQYQGQPRRMVKNIEEDKETLSLYSCRGLPAVGDERTGPFTARSGGRR